MIPLNAVQEVDDYPNALKMDFMTNSGKTPVYCFRMWKMGEGGFGKVICYSSGDSRYLFAVKFVMAKACTEEQLREKIQLLEEARIHLMLMDPKSPPPYITQCLGTFDEGKYLRLMLEFCEVNMDTFWSGAHTEAEIRKFKLKASLGTNEKVRLFQKICRGLQWIHSHGVLHKDLKFRNILLKTTKENKDGEFEPKIADFGLSVVLKPTEKCTTFGRTPGWAAPEVLERRPHSFPSDIWSLGVILFKMFLNKMPFPQTCSDKPDAAISEDDIQGALAVAENSDMPPEAKCLLESIFQLDPDWRPSIDHIVGHILFANPKYQQREVPRKEKESFNGVDSSVALVLEFESQRGMVKYLSRMGFAGLWISDTGSLVLDRGRFRYYYLSDSLPLDPTTLEQKLLVLLDYAQRKGLPGAPAKLPDTPVERVGYSTQSMDDVTHNFVRSVSITASEAEFTLARNDVQITSLKDYSKRYSFEDSKGVFHFDAKNRLLESTNRMGLSDDEGDALMMQESKEKQDSRLYF